MVLKLYIYFFLGIFLELIVQAAFPPNYNYMIQCVTKLPKLPSYWTDAFVNVTTAESAQVWFFSFEEHSKTTMPQIKGYEIKKIKGKWVIFFINNFM